jgi:hypothetical protein
VADAIANEKIEVNGRRQAATVRLDPVPAMKSSERHSETGRWLPQDGIIALSYTRSPR